MNEQIEIIKRYILSRSKEDDKRRVDYHLRELAEEMAKTERAGYRSGRGQRPDEFDTYLHTAAETLASFIHAVWGGTDPSEYGPGVYQAMLAIQDRVKGMNPGSRWTYAIFKFGAEVGERLKKVKNTTLDPEMETGIIHEFFDNVEDHDYLHGVAQAIEQFHWERKHSPQSLTAEVYGLHNKPKGPRGQTDVETHLRRMAIEGLATYIEQSNIARGNIDKPTDPVIILHDRVAIQDRLGVRNDETWEVSAQEIADHIELRFSTAEGRKMARRARKVWLGRT